jgi:hypothetical protein
MTGGESTVSKADLDKLMLDFIRVIRMQWHVNSSEETFMTGNKVWLNLGRTAPLFIALGLKPQQPEVQWMLISKLYKELCLDEVLGMYKNGTPLDQNKLMNDLWIDYSELDDEVMVSILLLPFNEIESRISEADIKPQGGQSVSKYVVRLWPDDNKLMMYINNDGFEVGRLGDDKLITQIMTRLVQLPAGRQLTGNDVAPNRNKLNLKQEIHKNRYGWIFEMLTTSEPRRLAISNPSEFNEDQMRTVLTQINAKYRKPIQQHLGFDD